ncbi:heparan-alpha-glucosaminide N-acetyltransferase domain-containing protein [Niabella ginsengisoli]|uniref:Heparan-alpha-glucosaminide N-acetyltransferase domain-containing protein n=1 Tax=Niabella ginsengisoli TaxID=522298 RepID=A0ABS9SPF2_9BACT|nr:heparan-alpha-glucosaminide N-acetyltransferase domain-containing protein [Niabella ginsengisoli]MCH5600234.1 heparan-alpha-glucosaminide N-acetyltransferase domain-containing protein [Niabella ginsengisoli]
MQHSKANIINRIEAIDALRGFALLAITFRHFLTRYNYDIFIYSSNNTVAKADKLVEFIDFHLFYGKAYAIFALLFGFSLFLQQKSKAGHFKRYMIARLLVLLLLACINSIFFLAAIFWAYMQSLVF